MIRTNILLILGILCHCCSNAQSDDSISFITPSSYEALTSECAIQQRPALVYIHGDQCFSCQVTEQTTFKDSELVSLVDRKFVATKVDIHSALGKEWNKEFQVTCVPTLLILGKNGHLMGRFHSVITASTLTQLLNKGVALDQITQLANANDGTATVIDTKSIVLQKERITKEVVAQLKYVLEQSKSGNHRSSEELEKELLCSSDPEKSITTISTTLLEIADANTSALFDLTERDFQKLLSKPNQVNFLIQDLNASLDGDPLSEMVVAPFVPIEDTNTQQQLSMKPSVVQRILQNGSYHLKFGSYVDYDKTAKLIEELKAISGKDIYLLIEKKGRYKSYSVLAKGFSNQQEANDFLQLLATDD